MQPPTTETTPTAQRPPQKPSPWRWVARIVLVGFLALIFGFSYVYAEKPTVVFMFVFFFIGLVFLGGKVLELHRAVTALHAEVIELREGREGKT